MSGTGVRSCVAALFKLSKDDAEDTGAGVFSLGKSGLSVDGVIFIVFKQQLRFVSVLLWKRRVRTGTEFSALAVVVD